MPKITPYKGGRNVTIRARLTEAEKEIVKARNLKVDYIQDYVKSTGEQSELFLQRQNNSNKALI